MNNLEKFYCRLALELHIPLVEVHNLPSWEIQRWQEYFNTVPFTVDRTEYQLAQIAYILFSQSSKEKVKIDDFIPKLKPKETEEVNQDELRMKLEVIKGYLGKGK